MFDEYNSSDELISLDDSLLKASASVTSVI